MHCEPQNKLQPEKHGLMEIYCLFIRSRTGHCGVAFHLSLTQNQTKKLTNIEKTCIKLILQEMYVGYTEACKMVGIIPLSERRQNRTLDFAKKCVKHPKNSRLFPVNESLQVDPQTRQREIFKVNFARTESYRKSTIPTCQRLLNAHYSELPAGSGGEVPQG